MVPEMLSVSEGTVYYMYYVHVVATDIVSWYTVVWKTFMLLKSHGSNIRSGKTSTIRNYFNTDISEY